MDLAITLTIIGLILGALPIIFDLDLYFRRLGINFSKADLLIEIIQLTYDIRSISEVKVYVTAKYKVLSDNSILNIPVKNVFGDSNKYKIRIDNKIITPEISGTEYKKEAKYNLTNKNKGDSFIMDMEFTFDGVDKEKIQEKEDGMGYFLRYYRCRQLKLNVLFPKGFYPENIRFLEGKLFEQESSKKEKFGMIKLPTLISNNRRQVEWLVNYPKLKRGYWIKWKWNKNYLQHRV